MEKISVEIIDFEKADDYSFPHVVRKDEQCKMLRASCSTDVICRKPCRYSPYSLRTPHFSCKNNRNVKWMLGLAENTGPDSNYISLTLELQSSDIDELEVFFKCSLKKDSEKVHTVDTIFSLNRSKGKVMRIPKFVRKSTLATTRRKRIPMFVRESTDVKHKRKQFKLSCKVYALPRLYLCSGNRQLASDLRALLQEGTLADVTLVAAGKELRAHKAILSARSPVFARMFQLDMREAREGRVRIDDVEHEVMGAFLRFAYTAQLEAHCEPLAGALIAAADKYQFEELRRAAANLLLRRMNVGNAVDTLQLAERYNYADLKGQVIEFINRHAKQIVKTPAFKALTATQAHLIAEIYSVMAMAVSRNESGHVIKRLGRW